MVRLKLLAAGFLNFMWNEFFSHFPIHAVRKLFLISFNRRISWSAKILMHTRLLDFWKLEIGDRSVINQYVSIDCRRYLTKISSDVDIGPYTRIWTLGHDTDSSLHDVKGNDVIVEDHVWLASGVTILPGVRLSRGCVVSAGSVVTKSIPSLEIWGGNPAKKIRVRQNDLKYKLNFTPYFE